MDSITTTSEIVANKTGSNSLDPVNLLKYIAIYLLELLSALLMTSTGSLLNWLSRSFSITLKMSTVVFIGLVIVAVTWALIRYRLMTMYSRLPEDDSDKDDDDLWLDDDDELPKSSYANYFDEFLSAIKVFGYLDKKVFDELTRHMRTYRIDEGETIQIKDLDGFAVVIDGCMQVYNKSGAEYQLINEVRKASPLSSLFDILSMFTKDVEINQGIYCSETLLHDEDIPDIDLNSPTTPQPAPEPERIAEFDALAENICAVAKTSSRIAVIPSEPFRLVARKYPIQTSNIIQVILLRWFQVTMHTCSNFFDLTHLVIEAEVDLNRASTTRVPAWISEGASKRLYHMAQEDPEQTVFTLKPRRKGPNVPGEQLSGKVHHVSVEQVDKSYPGDLVSNVPILSRTNSVFDQQQLISALSSVSISSQIANSSDQRSSAGGDSEDAISRKILVQEMFKLMGLDGQMKKVADIDPNRRDSLIFSTPNSPMFHQTGAGFDFNSRMIKGRFTNDAPSSISESTHVEGKSITYEEVIDSAANFLQIMLYRKGEVISKSGDKCQGLFYIIDGTISVNYKGQHLYDASNGNIVGYLETISSQLAFFELKATTDVIVARITKKNFEKLSDNYPLIFMSTGKVLTTILRRSILLLDFALEWTNSTSGETLFREGQDADAIYYVVSGRIRTYKGVQGRGKKPELKGEYGQGQYLAQLETLLGEKYSSTAIAIRETELARVSRTLIEYLSQAYPQTPLKMTKLVAREVARRENKESHVIRASLSSMQEFSTIAVLPTSDGLPVQEFGTKLVEAFRSNGRDSVSLSRSTILDYLGKYAFNGLRSLKLKTYLAGLEQQHETLVYMADDVAVTSPWTRTCIEQADCVLLLADAAAPPSFSDYEKILVRSKIHHRCNLILLHNDEVVRPGVTAAWLKRRTWVSAHHHIQMDFKSKAADADKRPMDKRGLQRLRKIRDKIKSEFNERRNLTKNTNPPVPKSQHNHYRFKNDFNRLARILSGEAVGLVLGGGGARGLAHIGVIKALEEKGIPVDMIGGTSIGSFVGGLYASDYDTLSMYRRAKKFSSRFASFWHFLLDLTYPTTSYTTGHAFNRGIWKTFGNARIEDFWLKYFNNTTNITHSRMEVHRSGYAWRYIRASMSLAGLVPPLEDKGEMLLDGGYMDNLPVEEMRLLGAKYIIAVDVGSVDDTTPMRYGDSLSGLWVLLNRFNPFSEHPNIPNLAEIQARLAYVSSVKALEDAKSAPSVLYLRPPIDLYATLDFGKFDEIMSVGYTYAIRKIRELEDSGELDKIAGIKDTQNRWVPELVRRHSF